MTQISPRCPMCESVAAGPAFPYAIRFGEQVYRYLGCSNCRTAFINPLPNPSCFARIYGKANYHNVHYLSADQSSYQNSVSLLRQFVQPGSTVLDYGCGVGSFLVEARLMGYVPYGVEFDASTAVFAASMTGCPVIPLADFDHGFKTQLFDVIHLGDVLEHLPYPTATLDKLIKRLKPSGLLFVEGPLEANPSPVYWAASLFGFVKYFFSPTAIGSGVPSHLFCTSALAQSSFFRLFFPRLQPLYWRVFETGWPYVCGNWIKRAIANVAIAIGGKKFAGFVLGNRFQAIFVLK